MCTGRKGEGLALDSASHQCPVSPASPLDLFSLSSISSFLDPEALLPPSSPLAPPGEDGAPPAVPAALEGFPLTIWRRPRSIQPPLTAKNEGSSAAGMPGAALDICKV